jgi:hypothetical protein
MPNKLYVKRLDRITLVSRDGRFKAKHPELRDGVVEVVKANDGSLVVPPVPPTPPAWCETPWDVAVWLALK